MRTRGWAAWRGLAREDMNAVARHDADALLHFFGLRTPCAAHCDTRGTRGRGGSVGQALNSARFPTPFYHLPVTSILANILHHARILPFCHPGRPARHIPILRSATPTRTHFALLRWARIVVSCVATASRGTRSDWFSVAPPRGMGVQGYNGPCVCAWRVRCRWRHEETRLLLLYPLWYMIRRATPRGYAAALLHTPSCRCFTPGVPRLLTHYHLSRVCTQTGYQANSARVWRLKRRGRAGRLPLLATSAFASNATGRGGRRAGLAWQSDGLSLDTMDLLACIPAALVQCSAQHLAPARLHACRMPLHLHL